MEKKKNLLTLNEVATILHVSYARAAELARTHMLPIVRLGRQVRVDQEVLECFIRDGGRALPGGWKRVPDCSDAEVHHGV